MLRAKKYRFWIKKTISKLISLRVPAEPLAGRPAPTLHFDLLLPQSGARMSTPATLPPFHLAFPVRDLAEARAFYGELLGCPEGRGSDEWVAFNFYGHQIVAHLSPDECGHKSTSSVDSHDVPEGHFGAVLPMQAREALAKRLTDAGTVYVSAPCTRCKGEVGEAAPPVNPIPSGNALEVNAWADMDSPFGTDPTTGR